MAIAVFDPKGVTTNQNPTGPGSGFGCIAACTGAGTGIVDPVCVAECIAQGGTGVVPSPQTPYRECYKDCRNAGGTIMECQDQCRGKTPGETGETGFFANLLKDFKIPGGVSSIIVVVLGALLVIVALALLTK